MFWIFFWMNVAIAATLVWSIRAYRAAFTYRMDVTRVTPLEGAVATVNDAASSEGAAPAEAVPVGVTADDFISLGSAADAGLAAIAAHGDAAVYLRNEGAATVLDLYVTPKARYRLAAFSTDDRTGRIPDEFSVKDDRVYGVVPPDGVLGTVLVPSGTFEPVERAAQTGGTNSVSGVHAILPIGGGDVLMLRGGCGSDAGTAPCDLDRYDAATRRVRTVLSDLRVEGPGGPEFLSYDAGSGTVGLLTNTGDAYAGHLELLNVDAVTGAASVAWSYDRTGVCRKDVGISALRDDGTPCTDADFAAQAPYWQKAKELGLLDDDRSTKACGALVLSYDQRRGRFLGCLSYDADAAKALFTAPLRELDAMING